MSSSRCWRPREVSAAGIDHLLERGRVAEQPVGRCERLGQQHDREPRAIGIDGREIGIVDERVEALLPGQVGLQCGRVQAIGVPGRVAEAAVLRIGCDLGRTAEHAPNLTKKSRRMLQRQSRVLQGLAGQLPETCADILAGETDQRAEAERAAAPALSAARSATSEPGSAVCCWAASTAVRLLRSSSGAVCVAAGSRRAASGASSAAAVLSPRAARAAFVAACFVGRGCPFPSVALAGGSCDRGTSSCVAGIACSVISLLLAVTAR
jgi:hypothetical protein